MGLLRSQRSPLLSMIMLISLISFTIPVSATVSKKLDQGSVPQEPETSIKCGECPCVNPCVQLSPPPPPPPPKTTYCTPPPPPPPPPPRFIYVTGVPGQIYQTNTDDWGFYSKAECNVAQKLMLLAGYGVLGLLTIW